MVQKPAEGWIKIIKRNWPILLIIVVSFIFWYKPEDASPTYDTSKYVKEIQSLQTQIDSLSILKDSIDQRIDTVIITIEKTHIQYEKDRNTILSNNTGEDYMFFLNYIRSNTTRFDSINNL